jgi:predicted acetyltransferase
MLQVTEQDYTVSYFQQWLLRMLDVPAALAARGYPKGVSGEVHLAVLDDMLPANDGPVILSVADGRADVRPGGEGTVVVDVRGLSALYSGYLPPAALQTAGYLKGPDEDLALLTTFFAGPVPWMPDHF